MEKKAIVKTSLKNPNPFCESKFKCVIIDDSSSDDEDQSIEFSYTKPEDVTRTVTVTKPKDVRRAVSVTKGSVAQTTLTNQIVQIMSRDHSPPITAVARVNPSVKEKPSPSEGISQSNDNVISNDEPNPTEICNKETIIGQSMDESCVEVIVIGDDNDKTEIPSFDVRKSNLGDVIVDGGLDELSKIIENSIRSTISNVDSVPSIRSTISNVDSEEKEMPTSNNSVDAEKTHQTSNSNVEYSKNTLHHNVHHNEIENDVIVKTFRTGERKNILQRNVHRNEIENDVIVKTFRTGERERVWELMKTKKKVVPVKKKIIYPVIVKEHKIVEEAVNNCVESDDAELVSPLLDLQSSLEQHIKELVATIQNVHAEEKKSIISTLMEQHQNTNKEMVESICQMLKGHQSVVETSAVQIDQGCAKKPGEIMSKSATKKQCPSSSSRLAGEKSVVTISAGKTETVTDSNAPKGKKILKGMNKNIRTLELKQKQAPAHSILKTPVRSRKPPAPFSEKMKNEGESAPTSTGTDCGYALLREILKDTSISSKGSCQDGDCVEDVVKLNNDDVDDDDDGRKEAIPALTKGIIIEDPIVNFSDGKHFTKESIVGECVSSMNSFPIVSPPLQISSNMSTHSNTDSTTSAMVSVDDTLLCNKLLPCFDSSHSKTTQLLSSNRRDRIYEYDTHPKLTLDERIRELRKDFITPENRWLYESKENYIPPCDTLQNATKVLKDVQMTKKMLETHEFVKYDNMFNKYDMDHYADENVIKVKELVDKNIGKITNNVKKKIDSNLHSKQKRFPLKEKNAKL